MHKRLFFLLAIFFGITFLLPADLYSQNSVNQAGLVIDFGNGQISTQCVSFEEEQISGYELLQRSGFPIEVDVNGGVGAAVCSINVTGCPSNDCFCQCVGGGSCIYWSYWLLQQNDWQYSSVGASTRPIRHGDVDGWVWGPGSITEASPPISTSFEQICPAQAPATNTPIPSNTPTPLPTFTSTPSRTPTAVSAAPEISFTASSYTISTGGCTDLQWDVQNVTAVFLDGNGVSGRETRTVCPAQTQTYQLRAVFADGERTEAVTIQVTAATATSTTTPLPPTNTPAAVAQIVQPQTAPTETATSVATSSPIPTDQPTVLADATEPAAATAAPTQAMVMVQVPLAPTATILPTPVEVAAVPQQVDITLVAVEPVTPVDPPMPTFNWLGYGVFFALTTFLAITLFMVRRQ